LFDDLPPLAKKMAMFLKLISILAPPAFLYGGALYYKRRKEDDHAWSMLHVCVISLFLIGVLHVCVISLFLNGVLTAAGLEGW
jgi:hypothetical protein